MVVRIRQPVQRALAGAFVALSLGLPAYAQQACVGAATAPVRSAVQEFRDYLGNVVNASEEERLANKKAWLDHRAERLNREYAEYNGEVTRYYQRTQSGLYVPNPVFNTTPTGNNGAPQPTTPPVNQLNAAPVQQQYYAVQQYAWPQAPVMYDASVQQPAQANLIPRERSMIVPSTAVNSPAFAPAGFIPAYGRGW